MSELLIVFAAIVHFVKQLIPLIMWVVLLYLACFAAYSMTRKEAQR